VVIEEAVAVETVAVVEAEEDNSSSI